jgi:outer membrane autotransporter protein
MDNAFDSVQLRLEDLRGLGPISDDANIKLKRDEDLYNGVNLGDINDFYGYRGYAGTWVKIFGSVVDQHRRFNVDGFQADSTGIAIGGDWRVHEASAFGAALSYNKVNEKDTTPQQNRIDTYSYQGTFYGWFEPYPSIYVDSMVGVASHKYQMKRNIQIGNLYTASKASFQGIHYGIQTDIGYAFLNSEDYYVAPLMRLKYTYLDVDDYVENGAGGLSLATKNHSVDEFIAGLGFRFALRKDYVQAIYVPEFSAMIAYDFSGQPMQMASTFLGGGNPFYIDSVNPAQLIYLFGLGVNAHTSDHYTFSIKFNFENRDHLFGYNGYMQLHYTFA